MFFVRTIKTKFIYWLLIFCFVVPTHSTEFFNFHNTFIPFAKDKRFLIGAGFVSTVAIAAIILWCYNNKKNRPKGGAYKAPERINVEQPTSAGSTGNSYTRKNTNSALTQSVATQQPQEKKPEEKQHFESESESEDGIIDHDEKPKFLDKNNKDQEKFDKRKLDGEERKVEKNKKESFESESDNESESESRDESSSRDDETSKTQEEPDINEASSIFKEATKLLLKIENAIIEYNNDLLPGILCNSKNIITNLQSHNSEYCLNNNNNDKIFGQISESFKSASCLVPEKCISLIHSFVNYKEHYGSEIEKELYKKISSSEICASLADRLLNQRPFFYYKTQYLHCLRIDIDNENIKKIEYLKNKKATDFFANLPNDEQNIQNYCTDDEVQISGLLALYSPCAIPCNKGNRGNGGIVSCKNDYYDGPVFLAGLVGACFEHPGLLQWPFMVISENQNTNENGYGDIERVPSNEFIAKYSKLIFWANFYGLENNFPTFQKATAALQMKQKLIEAIYDMEGKNTKCEQKNFVSDTISIDDKTIFSKFDYIPFFNFNASKYIIFNIAVYKTHMQFIIKNFLDEAIKNNKNIIYCCGLGTGVWGTIEEDKCQYKANYKNDTIWSINTSVILECIQIDIYTEYLKNLTDNIQIILGNFGYHASPEQFDTNLNQLKKHSSLSAEHQVEEDKDKLFMKFNINKSSLVIGKREPFEKVDGNLAAMFAWDYRGPVGNEGFAGYHYQSGDPAAAAAVVYGYCQLNHVFNPFIKENIAHKVKAIEKRVIV